MPRGRLPNPREAWSTRRVSPRAAVAGSSPGAGAAAAMTIAASIVVPGLLGTDAGPGRDEPGAGISQESETPVTDTSEWVTYHEGMSVLPDRSVFDAADPRAREAAAELVDREDAHFAGTYVREADSVVVLVATDDRGVALAEKRFAEFGDAVAIERSEHSKREIDSLADRLREVVPGFGEDFRTWGVNYTGTGLMVEVGCASHGGRTHRHRGVRRAAPLPGRGIRGRGREHFDRGLAPQRRGPRRREPSWQGTRSRSPVHSSAQARAAA